MWGLANWDGRGGGDGGKNGGHGSKQQGIPLSHLWSFSTSNQSFIRPVKCGAATALPSGTESEETLNCIISVHDVLSINCAL